MTAQRYPKQRTEGSPLASGLLLLNKKPGVTSFDSLKDLKQVFAAGNRGSRGKVGHTGTLDKFASGLLLVLVGRGVKLAPYFSGCDKEYIGTIKFGAETDTLDPEGTVIAQGTIPSREEVEAVLDGFRGDILQAPPVYSAIHIKGRRAYELAREGKEPEMKKRPVTVHDLEILSWAPPELIILARVSAGTYIRSLARDIALAAGSRAHLAALKRTCVGAFRLEDAVEADDENLDKELRPLDGKLFDALGIPCLHIDDRAAEMFLHGRPPSEFIAVNDFSSGCFSVHTDIKAMGVFRKSAPDELLGTLEYKNDKWSYGHVFADN